MPKKFRTPSIIQPSRVGKAKRIRIPKSAFRPYIIPTGNVVKWEEVVSKDPWWMVVHKRGIKRPSIGQDPREARAVQGIPGTLPERILYKSLEKLGFKSGIDFDFQSSTEGGRQELGGMVVDFFFFLMRLIIQVQGPTHDDFLVAKKDSEQMDILTAMGYTVLEIEEKTCYDEYLLEDWLRKNFGLPGSVPGSGRSHGAHEADEPYSLINDVFQKANEVLASIRVLEFVR